MPAIDPNLKFSYVTQLYEAMESEAKDYVYTGQVVRTFGKLNISMSHYSTLFNILKELGSIELVAKGARGRPTIYRLHGAPSREKFDARYDERLTPAPQPATISVDELEKRVATLERRLKGLDLKQVLASHEHRITTLEKAKGGSK